MANDLANQLQGLLGDSEVGAQLKALAGDGDFDLGKVIAGLQQDPDLLAKVQAALGDIDLGGALAGLTGGQGAAGVDLGGIGDALGGLLGGDKQG
jgi:hypothetical protein